MKYISVILLIFGLSIGLIWMLDTIQGFEASYTLELLQEPIKMMEPSDYILLILSLIFGYITYRGTKEKTD